MAVYMTKRQIVNYLKRWDYLLVVPYDKPAEFVDHGPNEFLPQRMVVVGSKNIKVASLDEVKDMAQWILLGYKSRIRGTSIILDFNLITEIGMWVVSQFEITKGEFHERTPYGYTIATGRPATKAEKKRAYGIFINSIKELEQ